MTLTARTLPPMTFNDHLRRLTEREGLTEPAGAPAGGTGLRGARDLSTKGHRILRAAMSPPGRSGPAAYR